MLEPVRIGDVLKTATERLRQVSDSARLDAELLLAQAIDMPRSFLFAHPEDELDEAAVARFAATLNRRLGGEPLAYLSGTREFWSLPLMVSPATLVPRPETELLVQLAIDRLPRHAAQRVLDLGTGSGAIALAIASERALCDVVATDISADAIAIARENARQLDLPNVGFLVGDWSKPLRGQRFDIVVSNPPYVADNDPALATLCHEPRQALVAGSDGLDAIRRIATDSGELLRSGGTLLLEHGANQQAAVAGLLQTHGFTDIECVADAAGRPRVSHARWATP